MTSRARVVLPTPASPIEDDARSLIVTDQCRVDARELSCRVAPPAMSVPPHDRLYTEFVQVGGCFRQLTSSDLLVAQRLSSTPDDDALLFHAVVTRDKVLKIIEAGVALDSVAVNPDAKRIVSGHRDGSVRLWDATTCRPIGEPMTGHEDGVNSVAFSPDGGPVVSGGSGCRRAESGTRPPANRSANPLPGVTKSVSGLAFSPGGQRIASGGWDSTLRLWDARKLASPSAPRWLLSPCPPRRLLDLVVAERNPHAARRTHLGPGERKQCRLQPGRTSDCFRW